jgi:hypothetical protein
MSEIRRTQIRKEISSRPIPNVKDDQSASRSEQSVHRRQFQLLLKTTITLTTTTRKMIPWLMKKNLCSDEESVSRPKNKSSKMAGETKKADAAAKKDEKKGKKDKEFRKALHSVSPSYLTCVLYITDKATLVSQIKLNISSPESSPAS